VPFTVSHLAAILPLVARRRSLSEIQDNPPEAQSRPRYFVPAALAIGAMVPDFPALLPLGITRDFAHSALGAITMDLGLALVLFVIWVAVLRAPLLDYAPDWVRHRMPPLEWRSGSAVASGALLVAAILVGIATHLAIDSVTHEGWLTDLLPVLLESVGGYPVVVWLHLALSIAGLGIIVWWIAAWKRVAPATARRAIVVGPRERNILSRLVIGLLAAIALGVWFAGISAGIPAVDESLLFIAVTLSGAIAGSIALVICVIWQARRLAKRG